MLFRITISGLRAQVGRLLLTAAAIAGGAGFLAGTFVYADTARAAFYDQLARSARNVDVVVLPHSGERIPPGVEAAVKGLPQVSQVDGRVVETLGLLDRDGKLIANEGFAGYAISLPKDADLARFDIVEGRLPQRPGEVAIDKSTAGRYGFKRGDTATFVNETGSHDETIVGVIDLGVNRGVTGLSVAAFTADDLQKLVHPNGSAELVVRADGEAQEAVRNVVPADYEVLSGAAWRDRLAKEAAKYVDGFHRVLLGFSLIALAVAVFVIYNTFHILTARRTRELALWRCLGAKKGQIRLLVLIEAVVLGLAGSLVGLAVAVATGWALITGRGLFGEHAVPDHALVLRPSTAFITFLVGTLTAATASLIPALRAGRIAPLAVLAHSPLQELRPRQTWPRLLASLALAAAGAWLMKRGVPQGFDGLPWIFAGAAVLFGGLILLSPLVVGRLTVLVGWLPSRLFGPPGRLALGQARFQPRRAAATTSALMVGVGVLATVSVLLTTASEQSGMELRENFSVDFRLSSVDLKAGNGKTRVPAALEADLKARPEFAAVTGIRSDLSLVDNRGIFVWSAQDFPGQLKPEIMQGDLAKLGPGTVAVDRAYSDSLGVVLGRQIHIGEDGFTVVAIYDDAPSDADILFSWGDYAKLHGVSDPDEVLVALAPGVAVAQGQSVLDGVLSRYPLVEIGGNAQRSDELAGTFDRLLGIFTALLGVSLLIALFGIGNTLALSVWERGREAATLRALGLSRAGLRLMLLLEAVFMALVGGGAGLLFGGAVGWVAATGLIRNYGHGTPTLPLGQFLVYLGVAALAAVIAALLPARAAARRPIVSALAD